MKLLNGFCTLKFHEFAPVAGFNPADPEIGHQKTNEVLIAELGHERCAIADKVMAVIAAVAGGHNSLLLKTLSKGMKAHDQVLDDGAVLIGKA